MTLPLSKLTVSYWTIPEQGCSAKRHVLDNHIGMKVLGKVEVMNRINFLGLGYHFHYTGTELFNLQVSSTYWNTTSLDEVETHIYDALDGSGAGVVQILGAESLPHAPFQHGM